MKILLARIGIVNIGYKKMRLPNNVCGSSINVINKKGLIVK